jgi:cell division protein FtsB
VKRATRRVPRRVVLLVAGVLVVAGIAVGTNGTMRVWQMQRELASLEQEVVRLRVHTEQLTQTVERLRNDPLYIEKLAREDLGYVREGETVLKFPSQSR